MTPKPFDPIFFLNTPRPDEVKISPDAASLLMRYAVAFGHLPGDIITAVIVMHMAHVRESIKDIQGDSYLLGFVSSRASPSPDLPPIYTFDQRNPSNGLRTLEIVIEAEYLERMKVILAEVPRDHIEWIGGSPGDILNRT